MLTCTPHVEFPPCISCTVLESCQPASLCVTPRPQQPGQPFGQSCFLKLYKPPTLNCYVWYKCFHHLVSLFFSVKMKEGKTEKHKKLKCCSCGKKTANWQTKKIFKIKCPQRSICQHEMVAEPQGHTEDMVTSRKRMALFMNDGESVLMLSKQTVLRLHWLLT